MYIQTVSGLEQDVSNLVPNQLEQEKVQYGLGQMGSAGDEERYQAIVTQVQAQLERKFRDPNDPGLYERRKELRRLFGLVPTPYSKTLYDRLHSKADSLGQLFRYKLATATRNEMLVILRNKFDGIQPSPTIPGSKVTPITKISTQVQKLARKLALAKQLLGKASKFLKTKAQRDLFHDMLYVLSTFVPSGYGVMDKQGKVIQSSKRNRLEVLDKTLSARQPTYFYDTWLHLSLQESTAAGLHRPFAPNNRNWIRLYITHLENEPVSSVAEAVIHELMHMALHRFRSIQSVYGKDPAKNLPTREAGALLDISSFATHRQAMEKHFLILVEHLNRQPHRASSLPLESGIASQWADHLVDEVMSFVFQDRVKIAIARVEAKGKGIAVIVFEPTQFLRNYFQKYWLKNPDDRAFINSEEARKILDKLTPELRKLVGAVESQMDL